MAKKQVQPPDIVEVPDADDMDDDTFLKHLDKRHSHETGVKDVARSKHAREAWVGTYRAWHDYQHDHNEYDHEHVWDDDEDE